MHTRCNAAVHNFSSSSSSSCFCNHLKTELFAGHMALIHHSTFVTDCYKNVQTKITLLTDLQNKDQIK